MSSSSPPPQPSILFNSIRSSQALNKGLEQARYATMATVSEDGSPACRYVVVRDIYNDQALVVTTDLRSKKLHHMRHHSALLSPTSASSLDSVTSPTSPYPLTELCLWFPSTKEQYRLTSRTLLIPPQSPIPALSNLRLLTWQRSSPPSRSQFDAAAPGTPLQPPATGDLDRYQPQHPSEDVPSDNFGVLLFFPVRVDYLYLPKPGVSPHPVDIEKEGGVKEGMRDEKSQARWKMEWLDEEHRWKLQEVNP